MEGQPDLDWHCWENVMLNYPLKHYYSWCRTELCRAKSGHWFCKLYNRQCLQPFLSGTLCHQQENIVATMILSWTEYSQGERCICLTGNKHRLLLQNTQRTQRDSDWLSLVLILSTVILHYHFPFYHSLPWPARFVPVCHNQIFSHTHWTLSKADDVS